MVALSALLDKPIRTPDGQELARLHDIIVHLDLPSPQHVPAADVHPEVIGVTTSGLEPTPGDSSGAADSEHCLVPWRHVHHLGPEGVQLTSSGEAFREWTAGENDLALRADLLDRNVLDLQSRRIVRVNDVELDERSGAFRVVGVDVGAGAILRRLDIGGVGQRVLGRLARREKQQPSLLDWTQVLLIANVGESGALLERWWRAQSERLAQLDPSDLAALAENLTPRQAAALLGALDAGHVADTLEEMGDEQQAHVLRALEREHAADVLEEMEPDEAADALQALHHLDTEQATDLLSRMDRDEAEDVEELVAYPSNTAGGLMTTDFVAVYGGISAGQLLDALRLRARAAQSGEAEPVPEALQEIYVVARLETETSASGASSAEHPEPGGLSLESEGRLIGVVAMRDLVLADPASSLSALMRDVDAVAHPLDEARQVARLMAEEDLVALPVLDDDDNLLGVVTIDDAIDVILPAAWRQRLPRRLK